MRGLTSTILILTLAATAFTAAATESLFSDDFQDGNAEGWQASGDGDISLTTYGDNVSLRMTKKALAATGVAVPGAGRISIGASFAANDLEANDACLMEATLDGGKRWFEVLRVRDGQDDSVTLHTNAVTHDIDTTVTSAFVRARVVGNAKNDTCWLDNVFIAWSPIHDSQVKTLAQRTLTADFLNSGKPLSQPISLLEFTPPPSATAPSDRFNAHLTLDTIAIADGFYVLRDSLNRVKQYGQAIRRLPAFSLGFTQQGRDLIPLNRGVMQSEHPYWELLVQPGKVWQETNDQGWSRAAVPFALQERAANCTHNGVFTWLFNHEGAISRLAYQISSETCAYFKFDMWGTVAVKPNKTTATDADISEAVARFEAHHKSRLPVEPLANLSNNYTGIDIDNLAIGDGVSPSDLSVYGLVVDGIHYRSDCNTRHGAYPFCDAMALPSYSTAKSIYAGIALMQLEKQMPGISQRSIAETIPSCEKKSWRKVSIEDALDMATGHYTSTVFSIDEDSDAQMSFIFDDKHASKIDFACTHYPRKSSPQKKFVYHTSDTYLVGTALSNILAKQQPEIDDAYSALLVNPIWQKLSLSPLLDHSKRTYDQRAQPFAGYGLTFEADDIVRLADWLDNGEGHLDDKQVLDARLLNASLQRDDSDRGLAAGGKNFRYNNGFWALDVASILDCPKPVWVPFMSGFGGITIALFPNNTIYYYFSDNYTHRWRTGIRASHRIRNLCEL
ncbi:MAG: hypothetical protein VX231_10645 [Pseudomonadota bacterium]|nr:hypothetical protein [Pseudomonadota bacterium]